MLRFAVLALALVGCDMVFGVDRQTDAGPVVGPDGAPCPNDRDCDGVIDAVDNCIDVANPDQRDVEEDGLGDACDACVAGAPSTTADSDSDQIPDAIDVCPGVADAGQADLDGDGVGDACDPWPATSDHLRCFFGFEDQLLAVTAWRLDQNIWAHVTGVISHFGAEPPPSAVLVHSGLGPDVPRFAVSTAGYAQDQLERPAEYGLGLGGTPDQLGVRCVLMATTEFADTVALLGPGDEVLASAPRTAGGHPRLWLQLTAERLEAGTQLTCQVRADTGPVITISAQGPSLTGTVPVALVSRRSAATFFDLSIHAPVPP